LGRMLADQLNVNFVEINREIERLAGCSIGEIHNLYGPGAYHRYERRTLEEVIERYPDVVIATSGGIVAEPATFGLLLAHCYTVWLQASPEEHMQRVVDQGDMRPMRGNVDRREAMEDLKRILAGRAAFYRKADLHVDTSGLSESDAFAALSSGVYSARAQLIRP